MSFIGGGIGGDAGPDLGGNRGGGGGIKLHPAQVRLGVDIKAGNLVWIQGLYPAGKWPDIKIFSSVLAKHLMQYEHVEAHDGYPAGHPK